MEFTNRNTSNHHFIPVFYLKNFTNDQNTFFIYLTKDKKFKQSGKLFHPASHFYEKRSNTIEIKQTKSDFLETYYYQDIDDMASNVFDKFKQNSPESNFGLNADDGIRLDWFFGNLFWRNPANENLLRDLSLTNDLQSLGLNVTDLKGNNVDLSNNLFQNHIDLYKFLKAHLPLALFKSPTINNLLYYQVTYEVGNLPYLIGDNPIILLDEKTGFHFSERYIAPITNATIFIKSGNYKQNSNVFTKILIDLYQLKSANRYVACTSKEYIDQLEQLWSSSYKDLKQLKQEIIDNLII